MTQNKQNKKDDQMSTYLSRLEEWRLELSTNAYGMKKYAERAIKVIEDEINRRWNCWHR